MMPGSIRHQPVDWRLSALEAGFIAMETDAQPLHVGSLLVFEGPAPDHAALRARLADRLASTPTLLARLQRVPHDLGRPRWVDGGALSLHQHVHRCEVEGPGDDGQLAHLMTVLMRDRLDPSRAPWQLWQVDGCRDGRWALVVKAHHSMVDGVSGADLVSALLDEAKEANEANEANQPDLGHGQTAPPPPSPAPLRASLGEWARSVPLRSARALVSGVVDPRGVARAWRSVLDGIEQVVRPDLPASELNGPLSPDPQWAWVTLGTAEVRAAAEAAGGTVNDALLAALAGAYRRLFLRRSEDVDRCVVRAIIPVSRRLPGEPMRLGTVASAMFVELPVSVPSLAERAAAVVARTAEQKGRQVSTSTQAVLRLADHVPTALLVRAARGYVRRGQGRVNLAASNVRGPASRQTLLGRPLVEMVPYIPIALDVRSTVAMVSYGGRVSIAVTTDASALPEAGAIARDIADSLRELAAPRAILA